MRRVYHYTGKEIDELPLQFGAQVVRATRREELERQIWECCLHGIDPHKVPYLDAYLTPASPAPEEPEGLDEEMDAAHSYLTGDQHGNR